MGTDPGRASSVAQYVKLLDELRQQAGVSFRQMETLARQYDAWMPRTTSHDAVRRGQLPTQQDPLEFVTTWVRVCGADPAPWLAAWRALREPREQANVPRQLPADVEGFTGRAADLARLDDLLRDAARVPMIALVTGMAGAGKTSLAVHWAHGVADRFPDGQLHIDLRGFSHDPPLQPEQALSVFLQALGVPVGEIPMDLDAQAGLYRTRLSGRRILVVLDNAADARQVRPLLPGSPSCGVVVTSRDRLTGLVAKEGARSVEVGRLDPDEARDLLAFVVGGERAEPDALDEVARLCAYLPLALRISAANLVTSPYLSTAEYAARLGAGRLGALEIEGDTEAAVRAAFGLSYARLDDPARRLFRLLGLAPVADFSLPAAVALSGVPEQEVAGLLRPLVAAHLLEPLPGGRFRMHDLLRVYASDQEHDQSVRQAAIGRLAKWLITHAESACRRVHPGFINLGLPRPWPVEDLPSFPGVESALAWLEDEQAGLIALARYLANEGPRPLAWHLADCMRGAWFVRRNLVNMLSLLEAALDAAIAEADTLAQAAAHHSMGIAHWWVSDYPPAEAHMRRALECYGASNHPVGVSSMLNNLAMVTHEQGDLPQAEALARQSVSMEEGSAVYVKAFSRTTLAEVLCTMGRYREALEVCEEAAAIGSILEDPRILSDLLQVMADAERGCGLVEQAKERYRSVLERAAAIDYQRVLVDCHSGLAESLDGQEAMAHVKEALTLAKASSHRLGEGRALRRLSALHLRAGDREAACRTARSALDLHRRHGQRVAEGLSMLTLAAAVGDGADQALELLAECGVTSPPGS